MRLKKRLQSEGHYGSGTWSEAYRRRFGRAAGYVIIVLLSLNAFFQLEAHPRRFAFEHITSEDGLGHNNVFSIVQDRNGFMWFGTRNGLNRYDGYILKTYLNEPLDTGTLSSNNFGKIYEDRAGNMWFGTLGVLDKFDPKGETCKHYRHDPRNPNSLSSSWIEFIHEDKKGKLWLGTSGGGLFKFDPEKEHFTAYRYDPANPAGLIDNSVKAIAVDEQGNFWLGTNKGLERFEPDNGMFFHNRHEKGNPNTPGDDKIRALLADQDGILWIGTIGGGLDRYDTKTGQFRHFKHDPAIPGSISDNKIQSILRDSNGTLWIGTYTGGLNRLDEQNGTFLHFKYDPGNSSSLSHNRVEVLYEDRGGILWIGTRGGGVDKLDIKSTGFKNYRFDPYSTNSVPHPCIKAIAGDKKGSLWIGTDGGGLSRLDPGENRFIHFQKQPGNVNSLCNNRVWTVIVANDGAVWAGTYSGGLNKLVFENGIYQFYCYHHKYNSEKKLHQINCLFEDRDGDIWCGTEKGIDHLILSRQAAPLKTGASPVTPGVMPLKPGMAPFKREVGLLEPCLPTVKQGLTPFKKKGASVISPNRSKKIMFIHYQAGAHKSNSLSNPYVTTIYQDRAGFLWIGTRKGLNRFDKTPGQFTRYLHDNDTPFSLSNNKVNCLLEDRNGRLWIGTEYGLNKLNRKTNRFTLYSEKDGLSGNTIQGVLEDKAGLLWVSTSRGLSRFNPRKETFRNYDIGDGLPSSGFNPNSYYKNSKGEMYFGTIAGLCAFSPEGVIDNPYIPAVKLTAFQKFNEDAALDKSLHEIEEIILSYKDYLFSFEFAALDFTNPEKNMYAYKMEGLDKKWHRTGADKRLAIYTGLPAGDYVFKVKGSNNHGVWNTQETTVKIRIIAPPWKSWWAYCSYLLLILLILAGGYRLRVRRLKKRQKMLLTMVNERTFELNQATLELQSTNKDLRDANEMKSELIGIAAHDLKNPLQGIKGLAEVLEEQFQDNDSACECIDLIHESSGRMLEIIEHLLESAAIDNGQLLLNKTVFELAAEAAKVFEANRHAAERKNQILTITAEKELCVNGDVKRLHQVMDNLVSNAIKYSPPGKPIRISVTAQKNDIRFSVKDEGPGLTENDKEKLFGKFQRLSNKPTGGESSTGLGLSIAWCLVELHGGTIAVDSAPGKGSEFIVELIAYEK
ncbi:MAG: hypothetical protein GY757_07485 [bacterium]|nr:hypothetical protein [bacterium]